MTDIVSPIPASAGTAQHKELHGHTKIVLHNVKTGFDEVVEKDNLITNGVSDYYAALGGLFGGSALTTAARITDMFGAIALFNTAFPSLTADTILPPGSCGFVGGAEYGVANTTADSWRGSPNTQKSKIDDVNNVATFVYDFSTSQCNGTIATVALCPANTVRAAVWGAPSTIDLANNTMVTLGSDYTKFVIVP